MALSRHFKQDQRAPPLYASLLAVCAVMSSALCPQVVSQPLQHFNFPRGKSLVVVTLLASVPARSFALNQACPRTCKVPHRVTDLEKVPVRISKDKAGACGDSFARQATCSVLCSESGMPQDSTSTGVFRCLQSLMSNSGVSSNIFSLFVPNSLCL